MADSLSVVIGVLSLFRADALVIRSDVGMRCRDVVFTPGQPVRITRAISCTTPARWTIEVPGRISRTYRGLLSIDQSSGFLTPLITMDLETAVAATVAAEMPRTAPLEALKTMAVLARSYLQFPKHGRYDFCDTTHCQFHREPPDSDHAAFGAAAETRDIVITYRGRRLAPLYSAACGGRTSRAADLGMNPDLYPYSSVNCPACQRDRTEWTRKLPLEVAAPLMHVRSEQGRLNVVRQLGWSALPSNNYRLVTDGDSAIFHGRGRGHGVGVCQRGAIAQAAEGRSFRDILLYYLPGIELE